MFLHRCLLFLFVSPLAMGSDREVLSLNAAVDQALQQAPQIAAGNAAQEAARALVTGAGRLPDPALIVGVDNLPVNGPDAYSTTRDFMTMRKVGVMQSFPAAGKRRLRHARASAEADIASAELVETKLDVARETAQAWIRLATAATSLNELRALQAQVDLSAAAARAALASGRTSSAEALSAEATAARMKARILRMEGESRGARAALERWIGPDANRPLAPMPRFDQLPTAPAQLLSAPHLHGEILPFNSRLSAARTDVALARADRRPDWSSELSFAKRGPDFSDMVSFQFTVALPLFPGQRQNPVIAARTAELRRIEAQREAELRMHTSELQQIAIEWEQLGAQLNQYQRELLPLAHERSRVALAGYRSGSSDLRLALEAFQDEASLTIESAELRNEQGRAWTILRYLEPQHLHP